jgi:diguanylate cyclase (GGDEF)-like protein
VKSLNRTQKLDAVPISAPRTTNASLVFMRGDKLGCAVRLEDQSTLIGRGSEATLRLEGDDEASRVHAQIQMTELRSGQQQYWLSDLGSTNGTLLNGVPLANGKDVLLRDGDKFSIGRHVFKFSLLDHIDEEFHRRVNELIMYDDLTGLFTRKSFGMELDRELARSARHGHSFAVLMMDIDFFKRVNDTYGHLVGSQALCEVASVIRQTMRDSDIAGRYGGEEYIGLLPETNQQKAFEAAERIRCAVEAFPFTASIHDPTAKLHITISIGVACYPQDGVTPLDLIDHADFALYRAKESGRNQSRLYSPERPAVAPPERAPGESVVS